MKSTNYQTMTERSFNVSYIEYDSIEELCEADALLVKEAIDAMKGSFAPYSNFNVGAALRLDSGRIVRGANQENAAFPSGMCAERSAMFAASSQFPGDHINCIAIAGGQGGVQADDPVSPCGACRQVMAQYQRNAGHPIEVIWVGAKRIWKFPDVESILPFIFDNI